MKKDLIDTIMEKEFHMLSDAERKELATFCDSEDEFNQMKDVFIGVEQMRFEQPKPKAETKQRLDDLFDSTHPKMAPIWYSSMFAVIIPREKPVHRQPLAQIAAIALLALLLVPFWSTNNVPEEAPILATETVENKPNVPSNNGVTSPAVAEVKDVTPADSDVRNTEPVSNPVLVASAAEPVSVEPMTGAAATATAGAPGSDHPDGVFIAVSQPASENPEMFDLLTATF
ncbi:MAG: hypothetical protein Crog4KO_03950 [Crocinitomicaceae bacterium]